MASTVMKAQISHNTAKLIQDSIKKSQMEWIYEVNPIKVKGGLRGSSLVLPLGIMIIMLIVTTTTIATAVESDELDGGFSSLDGMLQWAIGNSDPAKLKQISTESHEDLNKRRLEIRQVMENLKTPSDASLMRIAIDDLNNSSLSLEDRHRALHELLILVEPIHNANDFIKLGGLDVVVRELNHDDPHTRKLAAWVLGEASQNNPHVQDLVLELGALSRLMHIVKSDAIEVAVKGLFAVSALIRNNVNGQNSFCAEAGGSLLEDMLSDPSTDARLQKKAVFLVGDLAESQLESTRPFFGRHVLLKSVVALISSSDLDLLEKAMMAIRNVLQLRTNEAVAVLKELSSLELDAVLEGAKKQLIERSKTGEDYEREFAVDLEGLRREIELVFHTKLEEGKPATTSAVASS